MVAHNILRWVSVMTRPDKNPNAKTNSAKESFDKSSLNDFVRADLTMSTPPVSPLIM